MHGKPVSKNCFASLAKRDVLLKKIKLCAWKAKQNQKYP